MFAGRRSRTGVGMVSERSTETDQPMDARCHCSEYEHGCRMHGCNFMVAKVCNRPYAERLAQGFVEATTEWDFVDLPEDLRGDLIACAGRLIAFADLRVVTARIWSATEERIAERNGWTVPPAALGGGAS